MPLQDTARSHLRNAQAILALAETPTAETLDGIGKRITAALHIMDALNSLAVAAIVQPEKRQSFAVAVRDRL